MRNELNELGEDFIETRVGRIWLMAIFSCFFDPLRLLMRRMAAETQTGDALRWPAEWETQEAVWLTWPHRAELWNGGLAELEQHFARLVAAIAQRACVRLNAASDLHSHIRRLLSSACNVELFDHPSDDVWCRDHGAIFVQRRDGSLQAANWRFNAWGGKFPPWDKDDAIAPLMAASQHIPCLSSEMILEGGAIEGNGTGLVLTTEAVLLNPNRNPSVSKADVERELYRMLGTKRVFWLGSGIEGDDTDGHIDDMVRFVREDAVVAVCEDNPAAPNYRALAENNERLQDLRTLSGSHVEVIPLPMPSPLIRTDWRLHQLPASYANFLICNGAVLVPIFGRDKQDDTALGILREAFPGTQVIGIDARPFVLEGGAIHCLTQQQTH